MNKIRFSSNLKEVRQFLGLTQADLAKKCNLRPSAISHVESNRREPKLSTAFKIANALGVTLDRLLK